jgi:hypothetical protein
LNPRSTHHHSRSNASTSSVEKSAAFREVPRMNQCAAASVCCAGW